MDMTGEKPKGRKRYIVTDTMGNLLCIHTQLNSDFSELVFIGVLRV